MFCLFPAPKRLYEKKQILFICRDFWGFIQKILLFLRLDCFFRIGFNCKSRKLCYAASCGVKSPLMSAVCRKFAVLPMLW